MLPDWGQTTLLLNGAYSPNAEEIALITRRGTQVEAVPIVRIDGVADVVLQDGRTLSMKALFTQPHTTNERRSKTASHTQHWLQTTLNAGQEEIVVYLRTHLRLSLGDLLAVIREFIEPAMSRSALDRLLRRRGVKRLPEPEIEKTRVKSFKAYEQGYVHMDVMYLPQMEDETERRYVFVPMDRATRWVFIAIKSKKTAAASRSFLYALHKAAPFKIKTLLTDNGREFTDRAFGRREKDASGEHELDALCQALGIEHRLPKPKHPQTNGMVERFNGRLAQVLKSNRFASAHELETTLHRFVWLYNEHLPQHALDLNTPIQALKKWQDTYPDLFAKQVVNHPGPDYLDYRLIVFPTSHCTNIS